VARDGSPHSYSGTNLDNEYGQIDGQAITYDDAGNLSVDEDGRHYYYDEYNRLVEVRAANDTTVLITYMYDALGRRIATNWMWGGRFCTTMTVRASSKSGA
jgi:YD repeat-containing protein